MNSTSQSPEENMYSRQVFRVTTAAMFLTLLASAHAQTSDWKVVQQIPPGSRLSLAAFPSVISDCVFQSATEEKLWCKQGWRSRSKEFDRRNVWQISLHGRRRPRHLGKIVGGSVGGAVGALGSDGVGARDRVAASLLIGGLGVMLGSFADAVPTNPRETVVNQKQAEKR
jgi:hypothetical protein